MASGGPLVRRPTRGAVLPPFPHVTIQVDRPRLIAAIAILLALGGGALVGWLAVAVSVVKVAALLIGLAGLVLVVSDPRAGLWAVLGVVTLLPFAVIPVKVGLTLTLFEVAALGALGVWALRLLLHRDERIVAGAPAAWIVLLLAMTLFAFLLGVNNGYTTQTFHDYGKFVLGVLLVFVVWNTIRSIDDARRLVTVIMLGAAGGAAIGLALYAGGAGFTLRVLSRLISYGYPSTRIVRYIEDNPAKAMRLISTSVDPNSFGGLLALAFVLACAAAIARRRLIPRWVSVPTAALTGAAMLLTQSRGAWVGAAAGLTVLTVLRYRRLLLPEAGLALLVLVVGLGGNFLHRLWLGLTLQDPATKLRLSEYRNALAIIREDPAFGVGFGSAPSINLQTGVSSIYLAIAERAGLITLAVFLIAVGTIWVTGFRSWRRRRETAEGDLDLALLATLSSALAVGVFDHYFFNIQFPHMVALFWMIGGLILALADLPRPRRAADLVPAGAPERL